MARKNFENLRQDTDDNEAEPKVVRRGRPPSENSKKSPGRPSLDLAGSELPPGATLATGGENKSSEKSGFADLSGQFHGSRNEAYVSTDNRFEKNEETAGMELQYYFLCFLFKKCVLFNFICPHSSISVLNIMTRYFHLYYRFYI